MLTKNIMRVRDCEIVRNATLTRRSGEVGGLRFGERITFWLKLKLKVTVEVKPYLADQALA